MVFDVNVFDEDNYRCVSVQGIVIKKWSFFDDFAYTKASAFAKSINKMSKKEFLEEYPEFGL